MAVVPSINPNEPVKPETEGSAGARSSASTFDTMEQLVEEKIAEKKEGKDEGRKPDGDAVSTEKEREEETEEDGKESSDDEADEEGDESGDSDSEQDSGKDNDEDGDGRDATDKITGARPDRPLRMFTVSCDGDSFDIPEHLEVETKIDGKKEKVTIAQLTDNYSGKVVWEKRYNDLHKEKKSFTDQMAFVNQRVDYVLQLSQNDPVQGFMELCKVSGRTPEQATKAWEKFTEEAQRWSVMSEAEQTAELTARERDYYKRLTEAEARSKTERIAETQREEQTRAFQERYGISSEEWESASTQAKTLYQGQQITPEHVVLANRIVVAESVLKETAPDRLKEGDSALGDLLKVAMENPEFTSDDLREIAEKAYGSESAKRLGRKVAPRVAKHAHRTTEASGPASWDDV